MKSKYLLFALVLLFSACFGTEKGDLKNVTAYRNDPHVIKGDVVDICGNCNIDLLRKLRFDIKNIHDEDLKLFLKCFNKECFKDVEFSQAANYTLFVLLKDIPADILKIVALNKSELNLEFILLNLKSPVSEEVDVLGARAGIEKADIETEIKKEFLEALPKNWNN